jgi:alpha-D-ribose 1-methylphosphonate 5-triphosphate diphosphatase PhnM
VYKNKMDFLGGIIATGKNNRQIDTVRDAGDSGRTILKAGRVIDPRNNLDSVTDLSIRAGQIVQCEADIKPEKGDAILNCEGLMVLPGLIDMHLHLGDLFEVTTNPIIGAVADGVTMGLSPGAGNSFLEPSLLGAEIDRGLPMNLGVYLGALNVLGTCLSDDELIKMFRGEMDSGTLSTKMSRNGIAITTAMLCVGIKDHMGHFIMPNESIERIYKITDGAGLVFMSHTQDPEHAVRLAALSKGRPLHLAHATAAGCGTHADAAEGMRAIVNMVDSEIITAEFVATMMRSAGGCREGLIMPKVAQQVAYDALASGKVKILVSDGQNDATMKGFGDTRDNIPAILELAGEGIMALKDSVAAMTCNPAELIRKRSGCDFWRTVGHLGVGALANVTVVDPKVKRAAYTIVNGDIVAFESRAVRKGYAAGGWISKFGMLRNTGVGDLAMLSRQR